MQALKRMLEIQGRQAVGMEVIVTMWPMSTPHHELWRQQRGRQSVPGGERAVAAAGLAAGLPPDLVALLTHSELEVTISATEILGSFALALECIEVRILLCRNACCTSVPG